MYKFLALLIATACLYFGYLEESPAFRRGDTRLNATSGTATSPASQGDQILADACQAERSNLQVTGQGIVTKILPDDTNGSRHQRFLLQLQSGQTLLVAHNIDLAPRLPGLKTGDTVQFHGEYEWNNKGGVIHWTHRDPQRRHPGGWLKHGGRIYQ